MLGVLRLEQRAQVVGHRKHAALAVLRRAGVEPDLAGREVDLPPFERQHLDCDAPAGDVGELDDGLQRRRQMCARRPRTARARRIPVRVLSSRSIGNVRPVQQLARLDRESEDPLQDRQLAIDLGVADVADPLALALDRGRRRYPAFVGDAT